MTGASGQRRHESPELGDAIVRMLRGLVTRASEGDTEAVEQLARIDQLTGPAKALGLRLAWHAGYSWTQLGDALGVSRQAARQLGVDTFTSPEAWEHSSTPEAHKLLPGHDKRTCQLPSCRPVSYPAPVAAL